MDSARLYRFLRPILTFLMKVIFRPKIIGKENIPTDGSMVLAGNHTNILDPVLILASTKRTVHFLAKKELIDGPFGFAFKHMGIIPVNRKIKDKTVLSTSETFLKEGKLVGIFPEGTTEKGRGFLPFKLGAVKMANSTSTPILPFAIIGKYSLFKRVTIVYGKPYKVKGSLLSENEKLRNKVIKLARGGKLWGK